jgi:hypothetical protein
MVMYLPQHNLAYTLTMPLDGYTRQKARVQITLSSSFVLSELINSSYHPFDLLLCSIPPCDHG